MVERRPAMLVAGHAGPQQGWLLSDHRPHSVCAIKRDGGPQVERRSMGEKVIGYVLANALEARRPAQHAELVIVPVAVDVSPRFDKQSDRLEIAVDGRKMQRCCV